MAAELASGVRAGRVTTQSLFHNDGSPRFELMQRTNAEYVNRGGDDTPPRHIGAVAEAIVLIWQQESRPVTDVPHIQLIEKAGGDWVAVRFASLDAARDWQDQVEDTTADVTFRGCVPIASATEALR